MHIYKCKNNTCIHRHTHAHKKHKCTPKQTCLAFLMGKRQASGRFCFKSKVEPYQLMYQHGRRKFCPSPRRMVNGC